MAAPAGKTGQRAGRRGFRCRGGYPPGVAHFRALGGGHVERGQPPPVLDSRRFCAWICGAVRARHVPFEHDAGIRWNEAAFAIDWPVTAPQLSPKDAGVPLLADIAPERLPVYAA